MARDGESMERDAWHHSARSLAHLEPPEQIGRTAAARALRRLNPVKVATQKVPVVFEPRVAASLVGNLFEAVHGMLIYRHESFLAGKLGEKVASEKLSLIDDATIPGPVSYTHLANAWNWSSAPTEPRAPTIPASFRCRRTTPTTCAK